MVDGVFAARALSVESLSAISVVIPFFNIAMAIGSMFAMGGSVLVAKKKGKKLEQESRENLTLITLVVVVASTLISLLSWVFTDQILNLLGANDYIFDLARQYLRLIILFFPSLITGLVLAQFLIADGRPTLSMVATVSGILVSTGLNVLFLFVFDMGIYALALATGIGYTLPTVVGMAYFSSRRQSGLYFVKPKWDFKALMQSSYNGLSEMITLLSSTVTTIVMNNVLIRIVGFEGVAAAGIVMAINFMFTSLYFGYSSGVAPLFSYNSGQEKKERLQQLFKKSLGIIAVRCRSNFSKRVDSHLCTS